jgi:hypothetical protein
MVVGNSISSPVCKSLTATRLELDQFCSPHRGEHRVSAGLSLAIKKDLESSSLAALAHFLHSSSAARRTASQAGVLSQSSERPLR